MLQNQDLKQLRILQDRLFNAYLLPMSDQLKWWEQINKLENQANTLKIRLGIKFDRNKADEMLAKTINEIAQETQGDYEDDKINEFLDNNPDLKKLWDSDYLIDVAFRLEDMELIRECLEQHKKNVLEVDNIYASTK